MTGLIISGIIGFLLGLAWCYWKQIRAVYDNRDRIESGIKLANAASDFYEKL